MFLVFGSNPLAVRLSRWCAQRQRCILVGLASTLPETEPIEQCEIIALPSAMPLSSLPLDSHTPTAILLIDPNALESEQPLEAIRNHWGDVPILTTLPLQGDGVDLISVDDVSFSAMQDRIRSWERKDGASVLHHYLSSVPEGSNVAIFCHDNPDPDALGAGLAMFELCASMGLNPNLYHGGLIEHQQNRAMVRVLEIPARRLILDWEVNDVLRDAAVVMTVDFHRPGANNILPEDCVPHIVIDHHASERRCGGSLNGSPRVLSDVLTCGQPLDEASIRNDTKGCYSACVWNSHGHPWLHSALQSSRHSCPFVVECVG